MLCAKEMKNKYNRNPPGLLQGSKIELAGLNHIKVPISE